MSVLDNAIEPGGHHEAEVIAAGEADEGPDQWQGRE